MSVPISDSKRSAFYGPMPSICERSAPVSWWSGVRRSKRGSLRCGFWRRRGGGRGVGGGGVWAASRARWPSIAASHAVS
jgi:hypothetical protein